MPWDVRENFGSCRGFAVVKRDTDEIEGCHETREAANRQLAALNIAEQDSNPSQAAETEEERRRRMQRRRRPQVQGYTEHGNAVLNLDPEFVPDTTFVPTDN